MTSPLRRFESVVRKTKQSVLEKRNPSEPLHPFDERNIHPKISEISKSLFDDGHFAQATFEAFKLLDNQVSKISMVKESGYKLMMTAFNEDNPKIALTKLSSQSEKDEQIGYKFIFAGVAAGIRNPRGHEVNIPDTIDLCLDHLSLASVLLRKIETRISP